MPKKGNYKRHKVHPPPTAEEYARLEKGETVWFTQFDTLALMLDTSIRLWAQESEPLSINVLVSAVCLCLDNLIGEVSQIRSMAGHEQFTVAYDYVRHSGPSREHIDLVFGIGANRWILFETVASFEKHYGRISPLMRTFQAYFMTVLFPRPATPDELREFMPVGVAVDEIKDLSRVAFFDKLLPLFVSGARENPATVPVRTHVFGKGRRPNPPAGN